ncbi:uncharacterized protein YkwD [Oikeobacillus pervagus]|uniref:Uncharacterized protein YkwD n=1 Tax=Oikeobacillus pervagus TaxID=1325931 RepID=A0AAJ1T5R1_9BACI|nr:CAP domain-containing protein [Oikeobacillus pervagus]MDQ0215210.1 uncharacterized protein YkwD [Oikeobacillus pervagus]
MIILSIVLLIGIYTNKAIEKDELLENPVSKSPSKIDVQEKLYHPTNPAQLGERPTQGISMYIGKSSEEIIKVFGKPRRIDPSLYGYDWWIYNHNESYMQIGVENNKVVTAYVMGNQVDIAPFKIDQPVEEIFRKNFIDTEILITNQKGTYRFELSEDDLNIRPLVPLGEIYAQIYLDKLNGTLSSVRFMNKDVLIKQRPYEMVYHGELSDPYEPSDQDWDKIQEGAEKQVLDLTNIVRKRFELKKVKWDKGTANIALEHSKEMYEKEFFSHESPSSGNLGDRLKLAEIEFVQAGENIAVNYIDAPDAVEGWLNSEGHRKTLLEKEFTHLGVGVYKKYYTQNFIQKVSN